MDADTVQRLLRLAKDGLGLCEDALCELGGARMRELVAQTASAKRGLIGSLYWLAGQRNWLVAPVGTLAGYVASLWTNLRATQCDDEDALYLRELADHELQFELAYEDALRAASDPVLVQILNYHAPTLRACSKAMGAWRMRLEA